MAGDFNLLPRCGAKAKSRGGEPCKQPCVMNGTGRCYWHGGASRVKHGHYTKRSMQEKKQVRSTIKEAQEVLRNMSI